MSTNLNTATSSNKRSKDVHVTSFHGGNDRGQMLQIDQGVLSTHTISADREQVLKMVHTMTEWLAR